MQYSDFMIREKINLQGPSKYDNIPFKEKGVAAMNENKIVFRKWYIFASVRYLNYHKDIRDMK